MAALLPQCGGCSRGSKEPSTPSAPAVAEDRAAPEAVSAENATDGATRDQPRSFPPLSPLGLDPEHWVRIERTDDSAADTLQIEHYDQSLHLSRMAESGQDQLRYRRLLQGDFLLEARLKFGDGGGRPTPMVRFGYRSDDPDSRQVVEINRRLRHPTPSCVARLRRKGRLVSLYLDERRLRTVSLDDPASTGHLHVELQGRASVIISDLRIMEGQLPDQEDIDDQEDTDDLSQAFNLLTAVDVEQDTIKGRIRRDGNAILSLAMKAPSLVRTHHLGTSDFEILARVRRDLGVGAFYVIFPVDGHMCALVTDNAQTSPPATGLALVDRLAPKNPSYAGGAHRGPLLPQGQFRELRYRVQGNRVTFLVDGEVIFRWEGDPNRLSLTPFFRTPYDGEILFGSASSVFRIGRIDLRTITPAGALRHGTTDPE